MTVFYIINTIRTAVVIVNNFVVLCNVCVNSRLNNYPKSISNRKKQRKLNCCEEIVPNYHVYNILTNNLKK